MSDQRKLSLCITTYNRPELTVKSFEQVLGDERIDEIIILDDHSTTENYKALQDLLPTSNKVYLYQQLYNKGMAVNKRDAIHLAKNDWCILFDSDNIIDSSYVDAVLSYDEPHPSIIWCPSFGRPSFDVSEFHNIPIGKFSFRLYLDKVNFRWLLNMCNYVVHRQTYLDTWVENKEVGQADTIWHNYNHLKRGGLLYVVPSAEYDHQVLDDSGWNQHRKANIASFNKTLELIRQL